MPSCAAVGCTNHSIRCKEKNLTLFTFPKDEQRRKEWIKKIKVKRMDSLPNRLLLCEKHFSADQFDSSVEMRIRLTKDQPGKLFFASHTSFGFNPFITLTSIFLVVWVFFVGFSLFKVIFFKLGNESEELDVVQMFCISKPVIA